MTHAIATGERLLVVDDEPDIAALVTFHLIKAGYRVSTAANGPDADCPDTSGAPRPRRPRPDAARACRDTTSSSSFARGRCDARRRGPHAHGAQGRTGPHSRPVAGRGRLSDEALSARRSWCFVSARSFGALRRPRSRPRTCCAVGPLQIDRGAHRVAVDGHDIELTPTEYRLLVTLAERRGRVQARGHSARDRMGSGTSTSRRARWTCDVQRLRTKLGAAGDLIETVRGLRLSPAERPGSRGARDARSSACERPRGRRL